LKITNAAGYSQEVTGCRHYERANSYNLIKGQMSTRYHHPTGDNYCKINKFEQEQILFLILKTF